PLRSSAELQPGMVIRNKYEIQERIGSGGMATVYRARHLVFNEARAIKVVSSRLMEDENFLKRFRNEAVVTRKLQHPNAVRVEDMDTMEDGRPFIVMELVEGQSLRAIIEREGSLSPPRALEITRQVASALGAAHSLGIVHRDIKPDNIVVVTRDGKDTVKVLDFGIAKLRDPGSAETANYTATQTGMLIGTPQYISPEQASGKPGEQLDGRSDIYSLGIVLYQMLTGRLPFESDTPMGIVLQHMQTPPPSLESVRPDVKIDPTTTQLLLKCLEKDPAKRFQMAQELMASIPPPGNSESGDTKLMMAAPYASQRNLAAVTTPTPVRTLAVPGSAAAAAAPAQAKAEASQAAKWIATAVAVLVVAAGAYVVAVRRNDRPAATTSSAPAPAVSRPEAAAAPAVFGGPPAHDNSSQGSADAASEGRVKQLIASGRRHVDNGEYAQAIRDLREALRITPGNPTAEAELKRAQLARKTEEKVLGVKH
ncbi:MAG: protein kinase domain-containing protein, partial [Terriglobales bacterium]